MADRELIAAILTAGMLPTLEVPQSRAEPETARSLARRGTRYKAPLTMRSAFTD